jgi:hypothetical protein
VLRDFDIRGTDFAVFDRGDYGPGIYALDLGPFDASREELRWECFADTRPEHPMDGVLVLDSDLAVPQFEHQDKHIWLMPGEPGSRVPLDPMVSAVGTWDGDWGIVET